MSWGSRNQLGSISILKVPLPSDHWVSCLSPWWPGRCCYRNLSKVRFFRLSCPDDVCSRDTQQPLRSFSGLKRGSKFPGRFERISSYYKARWWGLCVSYRDDVPDQRRVREMFLYAMHLSKRETQSVGTLFVRLCTIMSAVLQSEKTIQINISILHFYATKALYSESWYLYSELMYLWARPLRLYPYNC